MSEGQSATPVKVKLPVKTKIAIWWLIVGSLAALVALITILVINATGDCWTEQCGAARAFIVIFIPAGIAIELLILLPVFILGEKNAWSWRISTGLISVYATVAIICGFSDPPSVFFNILLGLGIMMLVPLFLLILDRKNYSKVVRQQELEKK
ncbi:MAG: hypothetical protein WC562_02670 [Dehalococcoidia bacterium]